ncbi:MAG TPA: response regulator transcription factor [Syntrophales bacterium]|nr:response regulator transcription factor [Syntrophales bacterium]HPQ43514.1 response regulator transcription factor [Syntrophales bacterium]
MNIKIILADDHKIVRDGLRTLIEKETGMEVVAEAEDGRSAVKMAKKLLPHIVIMDITMPDLNGIDATRAIFEETSGVKVIALSMHSDRRFVSGMLEAGASAYLLKDSAFEELATAIRAVVANQIYLSPKIADIVVRRFVSKSASTERSAFTELTKREREVLQLLAEGVSTKEIAGHLNLSIKTVETHRANIMSKLDIHTISELVKYAIREGLTSLEN